jgi:8-oxo-dGTP pyrophosphatase MutT (NUDIX family)
VRGFRKSAFHDTRVMQKNAAFAEEMTDFREGDRVMTVDGFPGKVTAVLYGPYQGTESYQVELDNDMGGGDYATGQLKPLTQRVSSLVEAVDYTSSIPAEAVTSHTADTDYPELETILTDRLPNENIKIYAAANKDDEASIPDMTQEDDTENLEHDKDEEEPTNPRDLDPSETDSGISGIPEDETSAKLGDVTPPSACSNCGNASFSDPQMTGRGVRMRCDQCGATMKSWGGQWEPEFPNSSQNRASEQGDYRSGGPGGKGQVPSKSPLDPGNDPSQQTDDVTADDDDKKKTIEIKVARQVLAQMSNNELAESLQTEAGIVQHIFNRLYEKARARELAHATEWWQPPANLIGNGLEGPANYQMIQPHYVTVGSVSEYDDPTWRWHFTAAWVDVQAKARRIRREGHVKIVNASNSYVAAEVKGDENVYETQLNYVPGTKKVADWACGCKWASYAWGRAPRYRRFEGRLCSHALATQYEASARGMFGKDVRSDTALPDWQRPHQPVVVQYEKGKERNLTRRVVPPGNMKRTFSSLVMDSDSLYPEPQLLDLSHPPVYASVQTMIDNGSNLVDVIEMLASFNVEPEDARCMVYEALLSPETGGGYLDPTGDPESGLDLTTGAAKHHKHPKTVYQQHGITNYPWLWGGLWATCGNCGGSGCQSCNGSGQVPPTDPSAVGDGGVAAGGDPSGGGAATASLRTTADYASADPLSGLGGAYNFRPTVLHSNSENPGSTGWATGQDPQDWGASIISNDFGRLTYDGSLQITGSKEKEPPTVFGVALKAADTGRVLMLQRSLEENGPAAGTWEFPGGHAEEGDLTSLHAGIREWEEETGQPFPGGHLVGVHRSGPYLLHHVITPSEKDVDFSKGRMQENPDGDDHEQAAWWDPDHAAKNPALRDELKKSNSFPEIKKAAKGRHSPVNPNDEQFSWEIGRSHGYQWAKEAPKHADFDTAANQAAEYHEYLHPGMKYHYLEGFGDGASLARSEPQSRSRYIETHASVEEEDLAVMAALGTPMSEAAAEHLSRMMDATLHDEPEPALPSTDGDLDADPGAGNTGEEDGDLTREEILNQFHSTAGARALRTADDESLAKEAMKDFSFDEQQELINEGRGARARNFGDLRIAGTHYEMIGDGDEDETILWV